MGNLFCGIDIGTTNLKVLLLDEAGETAWVRSVPAPHLNDGLGIVTDARALLARVEDLIIEGWNAVARGRIIRAISSSGIGEDGVCIIGNFKPLGHAIQWNDRRGENYAKALAATDEARAYPAILLDFSSSAGKWKWLKHNRPQELENASAWITMTDWPLACWSQTPFISATLAPRTGCYDVFTRSWLPTFLAYCNAPPLPKIIEAGEVVGTMQHGRLMQSGAVNANTLLVAGGHDHPMAASAIRRIDRNARIDSMGTANATYGETTSLTHDHDLDGLYVSLPISGAKGVAVIGMTEFSVTLSKHMPDLAAFYSSMVECKHIKDIPQQSIALLNDLAQRTKHYWTAMSRAGVPEAPIYASGGWARCPAIIQMRANIFNQTISVIDEPELVALGAAFFAAQAAGSATSFPVAERSHMIEPH
jgi:xylulokinase